MYLTKNSHGVYYYRRPIVAEDQAFWVGPSGSPKKEWSRSLRVKDRRAAIDRMHDASILYEQERAEHLGRNRNSTLAIEQMTEREREEYHADEANRASAKARHDARGKERTLWRERLGLSTQEIGSEYAAARDLIRERGRDADEYKAAVAVLEAEVTHLRAMMTGQAGARRAGQSGLESHSLEQLLEAYKADKKDGWSMSTERAVVPVFRLLREIFEERTVDSISRDDARGVKAVLQSLPAHIGKKKQLRGLTIRQAIVVSERLGLPTIQPKTINDGYLVHMAAVFNWAVKEQWITSSPFTGLSVNDPVDDAERRDPFSVGDLQILFRNEPWARPWKTGSDKSGAFWVPFLCLFHGLRLGEAAGLRVIDIDELGGLPVMHIREYEGRTLKNKAARGTLPIHPAMITLGFLKHVFERRDAGALLLFPEGRANGRGQTAAKLGERFSESVRRHGFIGRKLGMHSFRHNFEDRLREAELPERTSLALSRRTERGSSGIYGNGLSSDQMASSIAKVDYHGLDLDHLQHLDD